MHNSQMSIIRGERILVIIGKIKVTGSYTNTIDLIHCAKITTYWNKQGHFPADQNYNIYQDATKHAPDLVNFDKKSR